MLNRILVSILMLSQIGLLGCATAQAIVGPDGTQNQLISCSQIEDCYEKAREVCSGPYNIVNTSGQTSGANGYVGTQTKLLVKCGK